MILLLSLVGIGSAWADTYEWSYDNQKTTLNVAPKKGSEEASELINASYNLLYNEVTYTKVVKMESTTTLTFTTYNTATITVGVALKKGSTYADASKTALSLTTGSASPIPANTGITESVEGSATQPYGVVFENVPAGTQVIKRAGSELGVFYIKVEESTGHEITINTQPVAASYTQFASPYALSVAATASNGNTCTYQWQSSSSLNGKYTDISGATNNTYNPSVTTVGTKYYHCVVSADGCASVNTNNVAVNVTGGNYTISDLTKIESSYTYTPSAVIPLGTMVDGKILAIVGGCNRTSNGLNINSGRYIALKVAAGAMLSIKAGNHGTNGERDLYVYKNDVKDEENKSSLTIAQGISNAILNISPTEDAVYYIMASADLYIKQIVVNFTKTVTFNSNFGDTPIVTQQFVPSGVDTPLDANTFNRSAYEFVGWNTAENGTGTDYTDKQSVNINADMTLYAQWLRFSAIGGNTNSTKRALNESATYAFYFDATKNLSVTNEDFEVTSTKENVITVTGQTYDSSKSRLVVTVTGVAAGEANVNFKFKGKDGYPEKTVQTLFTVGETTYKVTFINDATKGNCTVESTTQATAGASVEIPGVTPRPGYTFLGWATAAEADATVYPGTHTPSGNETFYAKYSNTSTIGSSNIAWWQAFSNFEELPANKTYRASFTNRGGDEVWNNWVLVVTDNNKGHNGDGVQMTGDNEKILLRADGYFWGSVGGTAKMYKVSGSTATEFAGDDLTDFKNDMKTGPTVDLDVARVGKRIYLYAKTTVGGTVKYVTTFVSNEISGDLYLSFTTDKSTMEGFSATNTTDAYTVKTSNVVNGTAEVLTAEGVNVDSYAVAAGTQVTFKATPNVGYVFDNTSGKGWINENYDLVSSANPYENSVSSNLNLTPMFKASDATQNVTETVTWPGQSETHAIEPDSYPSIVTVDCTLKSNVLTGYTGCVEMGSGSSITLDVPQGIKENVTVTLTSSVAAGSFKINGENVTPEWGGDATNGYTYTITIPQSYAGKTFTIAKGSGNAKIHKIDVSYTLGAHDASTVSTATFIYAGEELDFVDGTATLNMNKDEAEKNIRIVVTPAEFATIAPKAETESPAVENGVITVVTPVAGSTKTITYTVTAEDGTTTTDYAITINVAAPDAEPVIIADHETVSITSNSVLYATQVVKVSGINLSVDATKATVSLASGVTGMSVSPAEIPVANGVMAETDVTITYFDKAAANGTVNLNVTVGETTQSIPVTYNSTAYTATSLKTAAGNQITTWNFAQTGISSAVTVAKDADYVNMKDVPGVTGTNFTDATILVGNSINTTIYATGINADKAKIKIPASGKVSVTFSDVSASGERKNRIVSIDGQQVTGVTSNNSTSVTATYSINTSVEKEIEILGYIYNGSNYDQRAQVRIYSIVYTPESVSTETNIASLMADDVAAVINQTNSTITATIPYTGTDVGSSDVNVSFVLADNGAEASINSPFTMPLGNAAGSTAEQEITITKQDASDKTYTVTLTRGAAKGNLLYVTHNAQTYVLSKANLDSDAYFTAQNAAWKDRVVGTTTLQLDDLKNSNNVLKVNAYGATSFEVNVNNASSEARKYIVKVTDAIGNSETHTIVHAGTGTLSSGTILTNCAGEFTVEIIGAGENKTVYPYNIIFYTEQPKSSATLDKNVVRVGKNVTVTFTGQTPINAVASEDEDVATISGTEGLGTNTVTATLTGVKAGSALLSVTLEADEKHSANVEEFSVKVNKSNLQMSYSPSSYTWNKTEQATKPGWTAPQLVVKVLDETGKVESSLTSAQISALTINYETDDASLVTVTDGTIQEPSTDKQGNAAVYAEFAGNDMYEAAETNFSVNIIQGLIDMVPENRTAIIGTKIKLNNPDNQSENYVTATFGGWTYNGDMYAQKPGGDLKKNSWNKAITNADIAPIDGYEYAISGTLDAQDEVLSNNVQYGSTRYGWYRQPDAKGSYPYSLPVRGSYIKFEPTVNGTLTVYILQNGAWNSYDGKTTLADGTKPANGTIKPMEFRPHSFYVIDSDGTPVNNYTSFTVTTKQKITKEYKCIRPGHAGYDPKDMTNIANWPEFNTNMSENEQAQVEAKWASGTRGAQDIVHMDNGSFLAVQKGIVKYTFYVAAGQTYYMFSNFSKLGYSGMNFVKDEDNNAQPTAILTLDESVKYEAPVLNQSVGGNHVSKISVPQYETITVNRSFSANKWASICLPFTMTEKEVVENFGPGTVVQTYDGVSEENGMQVLHFVYHEIQSIIAGYPYLIYPKQEVTSIIVKNKVLNPDLPMIQLSMNRYFENNPYDMESAGVHYPYTFTGFSAEDATSGDELGKFKVDNSLAVSSYSNGSADRYRIQAGDVYTYVSGDVSGLKQATKEVNMKGYRAYLRSNVETNGAKVLSIAHARVAQDIDDEILTGIQNVVLEYDIETGDIIERKQYSGVYNLNGQKVSDSINGLPSGLYIVNGEKVYVK